MDAVMAKILIADDHAIFRSGLRELLSACPSISLIDEASSGTEVLKKFQAVSYDCVLLDIFMPGENGLEIIKRLKAFNPEVRILVLSMYSEEEYGIRALRAGASGYLTKNADPDVLKYAIRKICSGQKYISMNLAEKLSEAVKAGADKRPHERLTDRELHILVLIASGKTVTQIAGELHLSVKTVSSHRAHILEKMGMKNNSELIQYAVKNSLVF